MTVSPNAPPDQTRQPLPFPASQEWMLEHFFDVADVGIVFMDASTRIIRGNPYAATFFDIKPEVLAGTVYADIVLSEDRESILSNTRKLFAEEIPFIDSERCFVHRDGTRRRGHWKVRLIKDTDGNALGELGILTDITEQRQIRKALEASEARYRQLLENAPFPLIITRLRDGSLRYGNRRAEAQLNFKYDEGIGLPVTDFYQRLEDRNRLIDMLREKGAAYDLEMPMYAGNFRPYWALISASVVEWEGEPAVLAAINEITLRKNALSALEQERTKLRTLLQTIPDVL